MWTALFVWVLIAGLIYWLVEQLPIPDPFRTILRVIVILALIVKLIALTGWSLAG